MRESSQTIGCRERDCSNLYMMGASTQVTSRREREKAMAFTYTLKGIDTKVNGSITYITAKANIPEQLMGKPLRGTGSMAERMVSIMYGRLKANRE